MSLTWPDLVIGIIVIIFTVKGFQRGFVSELAGFVALFIAGVAAWQYAGQFDELVEHTTHLGNGSSHVIGMVAYAILAYIVVMVIAWVLGRFASLPIINIVNSAAGGVVGAAKALLGVWAVLYVALLFPLSPDLRSDLRHSSLVGMITQPNRGVDDVVEGVLPWFMRPLATPLLKQHRV